jgi:hypothetical protein
MLLYVQAMFSIHARDGQMPSRSLRVVSCDLIVRLAGTNDVAVNTFSEISAIAPAFGAGDRTRVVLAHVGPTDRRALGIWAAAPQRGDSYVALKSTTGQIPGIDRLGAT